MGAERGEVADDVTGTTRHRFLVRHPQHRHRCFWRNPLDGPLDEAVEHDVADAANRSALAAAR